jgi:hypothetical protein
MTIISAVKIVEFPSDRTSSIVLRGCWCDIIIQKAQAPNEDTSDDLRVSYYDESDQMFNQIPKNQKKTYVTRLQCNTGRKDIFRLAIRDMKMVMIIVLVNNFYHSHTCLITFCKELLYQISLNITKGLVTNMRRDSLHLWHYFILHK